MGQTCSHCENCGSSSTYETNRPERGPKSKPKEDNYSEQELTSATEYDSDYDSEAPSSTSKYMDDNPHRDSSTAPIDHTGELKRKAITGFKDAIQKGNDSLVMYYVEEYPELDLFNVAFENGDNALHIAVRNSSYNLIYYLLTNGISVN